MGFPEDKAKGEEVGVGRPTSLWPCPARAYAVGGYTAGGDVRTTSVALVEMGEVGVGDGLRVGVAVGAATAVGVLEGGIVGMVVVVNEAGISVGVCSTVGRLVVAAAGIEVSVKAGVAGTGQGVAVKGTGVGFSFCVLLPAPVGLAAGI